LAEKKRRGRRGAVQISEQGGVRSLHAGGAVIQSAMRLHAPYDLDLEYTRCMMSFLLFHPRPRRVLMIGLGGGSLAKFVYQRLRNAHTTVVEIDPHIARIARSHFLLPRESRRLRLHIGDGADYVAAQRGASDIILLDGFEDDQQAPALTTAEFYDNTRRALKPGGLLVANFIGDDPSLPLYLQRLGHSFDNRLACLRARGDGNIIALAFADDPGMVRREELVARAGPLERQFGLDLRRYAAALRRPRNILKIAR
jgi:spermidine synthase